MKVNKFYEKEDAGVFNYNLTNNKISNIFGFRDFDGKQKDIVCIGAAQTMGRYVHNPYPSLIQDNSNYSVANLGRGGVADYQYDTDEFVEYINNAKLLVHQINSGRSTQNFNKNFNLGDVDISARPLKIIELYKNDFDTFMKYFKKNKIDYLAESLSFRSKIKIPIIYLYIAKHSVSEVSISNINQTKTDALIYNFPHLVTLDMVKKIVANDKFGTFIQPRFQRLPKKIHNNNTMSPQVHSDIFQTDDYYPDQYTHFDIAEFCIKTINETIS